MANYKYHRLVTGLAAKHTGSEIDVFLSRLIVPITIEILSLNRALGRSRNPPLRGPSALGTMLDAMSNIFPRSLSPSRKFPFMILSV